MENLCRTVMVGWYLGSIAAILGALHSGGRAAVRMTLLSPLIYHAYFTYMGEIVFLCVLIFTIYFVSYFLW